MTATYTFDVYSTLDGFGSYGADGDWGGYWGKQGPEFLEYRLQLYQQRLRMVLGANTFREMSSMIGPKTGTLRDLDPVNTAFRSLPMTVISKSISGHLDWPDVNRISDDAISAVQQLKEQSLVPLRSHGSLSMNRSLMAAGLIDEIQVTIFPVLSGRTGTAPIFQGVEDFDLQLVKNRTFDGQITELIYRPMLRTRR
jgi:dihydrofolate reductase